MSTAKRKGRDSSPRNSPPVVVGAAWDLSEAMKKAVVHHSRCAREPRLRSREAACGPSPTD